MGGRKDVVLNKWENMNLFDTNVAPFYARGLCSLRCCYPQRSWNWSPEDVRGSTSRSSQMAFLIKLNRFSQLPLLFLAAFEKCPEDGMNWMH